MLRLGSPKGRAKALQDAAKALADAVQRLRFGPPVSHVYNPLDYAWAMHAAYIDAFAEPRKRVVFLGMNPGPFGMAQTGVPFGDVVTVRDWMHLSAPIGAPAQQHPKRPVLGLATPRREISGARLWGAVAAHWRTPAAFFREHYIANYCPLLFLEASGRNLTPDKLSVGEKARLFPACDEHLRAVVRALEPAWVVALGAFAEHQARAALAGSGVRIGRILHPSPANPEANRDWAGAVRQELAALGLCRPDAP